MKKSIWVATAASMLCALVAAGSALAYFSYSTQPVVNVITTGNATIELQEEEEWEEGPQPLNPGETVDKTPTVANTGSIEVYVRIKMALDSTTAALLKDGTLSFEGVNTTDWEGFPDDMSKLDPAKGLVIVANLLRPLAPSEVSPPLFTGVSLAPTYVEGSTRSINLTLTAEAVQTINGKTPAECWGLL